MNDAMAAAERTPWLASTRVRRYNPLLALSLLFIPAIAALPMTIVDSEHLWPIAMLLVVLAFAGLVLVGRRAMRGTRINNDAVALMIRGDDVAASAAFKEVVSGFFGRDIVAMSLHNLGVLALRSIDLPSAIALFRASLAAGAGFRFRWQPNVVAQLSHASLAFVLAAGSEAFDEAAGELEKEEMTSPLAIAFAARARAMIAARRAELERVVDVLDAERALLRNVLPLNDAVLCEAMLSHALSRLGGSYRGAPRASQPVVADDSARSYVRGLLPEAEAALVSA